MGTSLLRPLPSDPTEVFLSPAPSSALVRRLLATGVLPAEDYEALPAGVREALDAEWDDRRVADLLAARGLLTPYQAGRVRAGRLHGLVLGSYRLLERLAAGPLRAVYRGEHRRLRHPVAVKALFPSPMDAPDLPARLFRDARAVARLRHPRIVAPIDAGEEPTRSPERTVVPYFVTEFVPGKDLGKLVADGPLPVPLACHLAHQIADALDEAHRHGLVHKDVKPSHVLVTPDGQAKLLDLGLVRDPAPADPRADVLGLGRTLYFALTGRLPPDRGAGRPPPPSALRPDVPRALDDVLGGMLAPDPAGRYPTAVAVMRALLPFLPTAAPPTTPPPAPARTARPAAPAAAAGEDEPQPHRVLLVDDRPDIRRLCRLALSAEGMVCDEAGTGPEAVARIAEAPYDLVLLDVDLPGFSGEEVLRRLRANPPRPHLKVVLCSGTSSGDELSRILLGGADDFVTKPFSLVQLRARVKAALRLKDVQDRSDRLNRRLLAMIAELEAGLQARDTELIRARNGLVLALAKIVEHRSVETGPHLMRVSRYCQVLATQAAALPGFAPLIDANYVRNLEDCAPLHDIGKAALPDGVLNKPGPLTPEERLVMQSHTRIGADTLREVARRQPFATAFLHMAVDIARSHHEKWDGTGYPDGLAGEQIPLSARLVAVADVYDALRSKRVYKPGLTHTAAVLTMTEGSPGHFDPALLGVFQKCAGQFDEIFREFGE